MRNFFLHPTLCVMLIDPYTNKIYRNIYENEKILVQFNYEPTLNR